MTDYKAPEINMERILAALTGNPQLSERHLAIVLQEIADALVSAGMTNGTQASTSAKGIVELATSAEAKAGTDTVRAVTPKALADALALVKPYIFAGVAAAGPVTLVGVKAGDVVTGVVNYTDGADASADFETAITVNDQIQQSSASNLTTKKYVAMILRMH